VASLNKVMLIGNAGKDAELRYMASGTPQSKFSLAVNNRVKKDGEWADQTEWFNVLLWGDTAERVSQYIVKGKQLYIEGRLQTRTWDGDDGQKHYMTEVVANTVQLLGKQDGTDRDNTRKGDVDIDDLPFE
jgi:single-strand DNA-binding protein